MPLWLVSHADVQVATVAGERGAKVHLRIHRTGLRTRLLKNDERRFTPFLSMYAPRVRTTLRSSDPSLHHARYCVERDRHAVKTSAGYSHVLLAAKSEKRLCLTCECDALRLLVSAGALTRASTL